MNPLVYFIIFLLCGLIAIVFLGFVWTIKISDPLDEEVEKHGVPKMQNPPPPPPKYKHVITFNADAHTPEMAEQRRLVTEGGKPFDWKELNDIPEEIMKKPL